MAYETRHAVILRVLAEPAHKDGGGMRWHPSGEPTEHAHAVADRIVKELDALQERDNIEARCGGTNE